MATKRDSKLFLSQKSSGMGYHGLEYGALLGLLPEEGSGKSLDAVSTGEVVENLEGGLCPAVDVFWLR